MVIIGVFQSHRHVFFASFYMFVCSPARSSLVCPSVVILLEVQLAQVQIPSSLCVGSICSSSLGGFWNVPCKLKRYLCYSAPICLPPLLICCFSDLIGCPLGTEGPGSLSSHHHSCTKLSVKKEISFFRPFCVVLPSSCMKELSKRNSLRNFMFSHATFYSLKTLTPSGLPV